MKLISFTRSRTALTALVVVSMVIAGLALPTADAAGPPYSGPTTQATGPAFFGPAPNPFPYCENPTYFDPFPENVNPTGRIDVTGAPNASVTTNGVTMTFELTAEGSPDTQYPGFFPGGGEGGPNDQPKGLEMAFGDQATIELSEPLFYTQWVFTDVDRANEGFFVTPAWGDPANPGQIAVFGGDPNFTFAGTTQTQAVFNDSDAVGQDSEAIEGRVQVDVLGPASGIALERDVGSGQSGFAIGGGCEPIGVAKEVTSPPTWNGSSFDVTYTIRVRNNLPSTATIGADIDAALAAAASGATSGTPVGIDLVNLTLEDLLTDAAFSSVEVISNDNVSGNVATNPAYNGDGDINLLAAGESIAPESEEEFVLVVQYTPDTAGPVGAACNATYELLNQARVTGVADGVDVVDLSDSGADPDPGVDNGAGEVDDPTVVQFDCPPAGAPSLDIVKTVLAGPGATCPDFASGVDGPGTALPVDIGSTVTYCISVANTSTVDIDNVIVTDPQGPGDFDIGPLATGAEATVSFDLVVADNTPTTNTASATGDDPAGGQLPPVTDPAVIDPTAPATPSLDIVKTVLAGPGATCPAFAQGDAGDGTALDVEIGLTVTYCISVANTGTVDVDNVVVTDPQGPGDFDIGPLAVGADATVSFDLVVADNTPTTNVASATGDDPAGGQLPPVSDPAIINPLAPPVAPAIELTKTVLDGGADCATAVEGVDEFVLGTAGDAVVWCFTVTNTGDVSLTNVLFTDVPAGIADLDLLAANGLTVLSVGETLSFSEPGLIPAGGVDNVASVVAQASDDAGTPLPGVDAVDDEDDAAINEAALTLDKAVVAGTNADCAAAAELVTVNAGTEVTYCFTVTNTGGVTVRVTEVNDVTLGVSIPVPAAEQDIAPGASVQVAYSTTAVADLVNTATAPGVPIDDTTGDPFPDTPVLLPTDPAEVDVLEADLAIVKTNNGVSSAILGQTMPYVLEITNNGPDPAVDVVVVDTLPAGLDLFEMPAAAGWTCTAVGQVATCEKATPLAVGEVATLSYLARVGVEAVSGVSLVNTAEVTSSTPDPDDSNNDDPETTVVVDPPPPPPDETFPIVIINNPPPAPPLAVPAPEVLPAPPLALTGGAYSRWLVLLSAAMASTGGVLFVTGRRRFTEFS